MIKIARGKTFTFQGAKDEKHCKRQNFHSLLPKDYKHCKSKTFTVHGEQKMTNIVNIDKHCKNKTFSFHGEKKMIKIAKGNTFTFFWQKMPNIDKSKTFTFY